MKKSIQGILWERCPRNSLFNYSMKELYIKTRLKAIGSVLNTLHICEQIYKENI